MALRKPSVATCVAMACLFLAFTMIKAVGESPIQVTKILASSAFGGAENLSYTLYYATPILLTALATSLALEVGLFSIGAEGQLYVGAGAAIAVGLATKSFVFSLLGATLAGAFWASIAGYLRVKRGTHEVISTIMLNFIGMALVNWLVLGPLKNPETQSVETKWLDLSLRIPKMWHETTYGFIGGVCLATLMLWAVSKTWWGYRLRATGLNSIAATVAGIQTQRTALVGMALSGAVAALAGFHEVFFNSYRLIDGFSPGYGFTGLAVALLARGNVFRMVAAAVLFAALHKGTLDLDLETEKITRDLSQVIQALVLVALAARGKK